MHNLPNVSDMINRLASCLLPPPPDPVPGLIAELAKHPSIANTETGVRMLRSMLAKRGVSSDAIEETVQRYQSLR